MKKLLLTLIVSLALCGSALAQPYETHWPGFNNYIYEMQGGLVAAIIIDGEPITVEYEGWDALEIAAFVGDDVCRAVNIYLNDEFVLEFGDPYPVTWGDAIFYTNPGEELYFKMYDHSRDIEYTFVTALQYGEPLTLVTGDDHFEGWDNPDDVISLSFTSPEPTGEPTVLNGGYWNQGTTWQDGTVPEANADVVINGVVTIPNNYTASANNITFGTDGELVIEEGGQLYHTGEIEVSMQLDVTGYGTGSKDDNPDNDGYRLFACPVHSTATNNFVPVEGTNLNTGDFDLYKFDESQELEWRNFEQGAFDLYLGMGYLYANAASIDNAVLRGFTVPTDENYAVSPVLSFTTDAEFEGWNLVGNPYTCNAYVKDGEGYRPYYVLNTEGDEAEAEAVEAGTAIAPMKGLFVHATATDLSCTFTTAAPSKGGSLNIAVSQSQGRMDNAILSFGNGGSLEKFQLNPNHTKVYMTQEGKDYAIVSAPEMGEMPVSFKAESNGTYTLGVTTEGVSFNYLHLIDNMTGANVDLLANPSYTFNALTTDYASRFRLVFATGNAAEDSFAFMSNGNLIVSNDGEATLQVVDVNGRILTSESINGSASVSVNAAAGVYTLRLVNGNDVKVQKIVIR